MAKKSLKITLLAILPFFEVFLDITPTFFNILQNRFLQGQGASFDV